MCIYFLQVCIFICIVIFSVLCEEKHYTINFSTVANINLVNIVCANDTATENVSKLIIKPRSISGYNDDFDAFENLNRMSHDYHIYSSNNSFNDKDKYIRPSSNDNDDGKKETMDGIYLHDVNVHNLESRNVEDSSEESPSVDQTQVYFSNSSTYRPVIKDGYVDGNGTVEVEIKCNDILFSKNSISTDIENLSVESDGRIILDSDWASNTSKLETVKIYSETELKLPTDCSWLPDSVKTLDLSRSYLKSLSLLNCANSSLENLIVGFSPSLSSLSLCLPTLVQLSASWSSIDKIKSKCQRANAKVDQLNLSRNKLTYFTTCGWPALVNLDLNSNQISQIDFGTCPSTRLTTVDLRDNRLIASPESLPTSVHKIYLSRNRIKKLSPFNSQIQEIDLSHNSLITIGKGSFKNTWHLLTLDLSHNKIEVVYGHAFYGLYALQSLDLSRNHINHVRHEAFLPLNALRKLNLDHNQLKQLDSRLLISLPSPLELLVKHNPWRCSCHLLAKLHRVIRSHCKPHCHKADELECKEGSSTFSAQSILQLCIEASNEIPSQKTVHDSQLQRHIKESDEDSSEEDKVEPPQEISAYAIAGIVLVILLPFTVLGIRTLYVKRKTACSCFNILAPPSATPIPQWSRDAKEDTDSETEM